MENNLYSMRGGFKRARMRKDFKQADVAKAMGVTLKTVMNWEQGISNPDLETAMQLADLFGCDLDYLVGRIEDSTHDIQFIHEYTGLSEKAIRRIAHHGRAANPYGLALNHLIEADGFKDFIETYMNFWVATIRLGEAVISEPIPFPVDEDGNHIIDGSIKSEDGSRNVIGQNKVTLRIDTATRFYMQEVSQAIMRLCEPDFKKSYEMCKKNSKQTGGMNNGQH